MLGHCVIINNVATEYSGSKKDVQAIKAVYQTMKFKVTIHENCSDKVRKWLKVYFLHFIGHAILDHLNPARLTNHKMCLNMSLSYQTAETHAVKAIPIKRTQRAYKRWGSS